MRLSLLVLAFLTLATASYAQEQERKLVDRLMQFFSEFKPDTPDPRLGREQHN